MDTVSLNRKRITVFAGHYGSGKTNIAVNYALMLSSTCEKVSIADLDIVNPYFRTKDSHKALEKAGIRLISSEYANTNVDTPALPAEVYSIFGNKTISAVIDVGGDDRGALALGRYVPYIIEENDYEMLFVINKYRFLTKDAISTIEVMREIEFAAGIKFTGIVNNSNLGEETTAETVLSSVSYANEVKMNVLGVSEEVLRTRGAVSEECAAQMAEGARRTLGCDIAVSVTGIAGPGGGTSEKPVGTVCFGLADKNGTVTETRRFGSFSDRGRVRRLTVTCAIMKIIDRLSKN